MPTGENRSATPRFTRKGQATRDRIIDRAAELIAANGAVGTTIEDVRRAATVSGSQMAHYFTDKRELVAAVIDRTADRVMQGQQPYLDHLDSIEAFESWAAMEIDYQRSANCPGCPLGSLAAELVDVDPILAQRVIAHMDAWGARIHGGLMTMQQRGRLKADAATASMAKALLAGLQGGLLMAELTGDVASLEAVMAMLVAEVRQQLVHPDGAPVVSAGLDEHAARR
ncbi:TetR/AcrR family transcriptional regulator [Allobranchiibius sp. CTAmp26]|uniref:TetR/AcrR family transcriptional regulator n=1 Tax=Allobranchiibius sp. CTAmp26 TaxID=2815214 RepID=UPI001AA189F3|nr:TetR/AcrR family transcriptional regulator [Allobranchiibius sp. CTAmp26]MBO1756946.1 TetR/AcrR family transcriptional regulator [Allobranchiibius sp. CTAmp26]